MPRSRFSPARLASVGLLAALALPAEAQADFRIVDYGSPWSERRPRRPHTRYIVLHTTEGAERGALAKLSREGEAHYLVGKNGTVHRVVDKTRIAAHAGRSMWEGRRNLDRHAVAIEVAGYHDRRPTPPQLRALRELLRQLQSLYDIPDERVLTHSMVAFGVPNRWHRRRHRGRKRCAMRLADPAVRRAMGLTARPRRDPDVAAGRLVVADRALYSALFPPVTRRSPARSATPAPALAPAPRPSRPGAVIAEGQSPWDIAREAYASASVTYVFPDGRRLRGDQVDDWLHIPAGTRVVTSDGDAPAAEDALDGFAVIGEDGDLDAIAGDEKTADTTIYLFPDGMVRTGAELKRDQRFRGRLEAPPEGTRVLVGYAFGGYVKGTRPPSVICGTRWNYPSTFYRFPDGEIRSGDEVDAVRIPRNTLVFFRS